MYPARQVSKAAAPLILGLLLSACSASPENQFAQAGFAQQAASLVADTTPPFDSSQHIVVGDTLHLTQMIRGDGNTPLTYRSSDSSVARVTPSGDLIALQPGQTTLIASDPQKIIAAVLFHSMTRRQAVNALVTEICPNQDEHIFRSEAPPIDSDVLIVHEYHDCQRLIVGDTYGPVVGILAHMNVASYQAPKDFRRGHLAALIVDLGFKDRIAPYQWLGIEPGTNCLILKSGLIPDTWQAGIINQPFPVRTVGSRTHRYGTCADSLRWTDVPPNRRRLLVVKVQHGYDMNGKVVVPPVARWDWDERHRRNYIGVKCGDETWCEIGPRGFAQSTPQKNSLKQDLIKGYYDEQYLSDRGGRELTKVFGTLVPGRDARAASAIKHDVRAWYHVADMTLRTTEAGPLPRQRMDSFPVLQSALQTMDAFEFYVYKFKLAPNALPQGIRVATGAMEIMPRSTTNLLSPYWVQINKQSSRNWVAWYRNHKSALTNLPTVRWRWISRDESAWSYCDPQGCCELMGTAER